MSSNTEGTVTTNRLQRNNLERANADLQEIQDIASRTLEHILVKDEKLKGLGHFNLTHNE